MTDLPAPSPKRHAVHARASDAVRACAAALEDEHIPLASAPAYIVTIETAIAALRQLQLQLAQDYARHGGRPLNFRTLVAYPTPPEDLS